MKTCSIKSCSNERWESGRDDTNKQGYCRKHFRRNNAFGSPHKTERNPPKRNLDSCLECGNEAITRGRCSYHYKKAMRDGVIKARTPKRKKWKPQPPVDLVELHRKNEITQAINWRAICH